MLRLLSHLLVYILFASQAHAAVKWNNASTSPVEEKDIGDVTSCSHLGKVEASKNMSGGFSYNLKEAKKSLAEKVANLDGDTFVMESGWDSGQRRTLTFIADAYKCN